MVEKKNIVKMLLFTAIFSLIFINIYTPFSSGNWTEYSKTVFFLISALMVISGIGILALSRMIMYKTKDQFPLSYWHFFLWIIIEICVIALIYAFFVRFAISVKQDFIVLFSSAFLYTTSVLLFPYTATWLYFALRNAEKELKRVTEEENFIDLGNIQEELVNFKDEKNVLRFSVKLSNLLFIESADNYVEIFYLKKGKLSRFVLRNGLKSIENNCQNAALVRCHRSYIINFSKVKVLRKEKEGVFLEIDVEGVADIPVSKTYSEKIIQLFSNHSG